MIRQVLQEKSDEKIKTKPDPNFILDKNSILRKAVKLRYSVESTIVVPRKLTNIIFELHNGKRPPGNQPHCQHDAKTFLVDWNAERHPSTYKHL